MSEPGRHGFIGLIDALEAFDKLLILAINGLGLGIGLTVIGFGDLVFMADDARLKTPFTSLGVAPEAASICCPARSAIRTPPGCCSSRSGSRRPRRRGWGWSGGAASPPPS